MNTNYMSLRAIYIYHTPTITTGISVDILRLEEFIYLRSTLKAMTSFHSSGPFSLCLNYR